MADPQLPRDQWMYDDPERQARYEEDLRRGQQEREAGGYADGSAPDNYSSTDTQGHTTEHRTDPETGAQYSYDGVGEGWGPRGGIRARRRAEERRQEAEKAARNRHYFGEVQDDLGREEGYFSDLQPGSIAELMGGGDLNSELSGAQADQGSIDAQRAALEQLAQIGSRGYTVEEGAAMERMRREQAMAERSQRDAVMQQMAMRGMAGGGAEMAGVLSAQQGAANRASQQHLETQAQMQRRAMQALQAQGAMAGQMRGQSFGEDATRRGAADDTARANMDRKGDAYRDQYQQQLARAQGGAGAARHSADTYNQLYTQNKGPTEARQEKQRKQALGVEAGTIVS